MLLPDNIHPTDSIYYNGAIIFEAIEKNKKYELIDLYQKVKEKNDISFSVFILCLDWLFLIDLTTINSKNKIELCT